MTNIANIKNTFAQIKNIAHEEARGLVDTLQQLPEQHWTPITVLTAISLLNKHSVNTGQLRSPDHQQILSYNKRTISLLGDYFIIRFPHDLDIISNVKNLPNCKHNAARKYWYLPFKYEYVKAVEIFQQRFDFRILCEGEIEQLKSAHEATDDNTAYLFKLKPFNHQLELFNISRNCINYAFLMEQGTGKTKPAIDTSAWLYSRNEINSLLIVSLNGVHLNWLDREIPPNMPDHVPTRMLAWENKKTKKYAARVEHLLDPEFKGLRIFSISFDAIITKHGYAIAERFLRTTRCMMVVDESHKIKNPSRKVQRPKKVTKLGLLAKYRRILTGTPITQSPFDFYTQFKFLDPEILGFRTYTVFKHHFAEWEKATTYDKKKQAEREYEVLVEYKNMDELIRLINPYSYRVTKKECLDLPDKIYKTIPVVMAAEQQRLYRKLEKESRLELDGYVDALIAGIEDTRLVGPKNVLTKLLRLQQLTGGYLVTESKDKEFISSAKYDAAMEVVSQAPGKVIIWTRFVHEIEHLRDLLVKAYGQESVVMYYGSVDKDTRHHNIDLFEDKNSPVRFFLGQVAAGVGFTLVAAETVIYYSNDFSLDHRLQSEDRSHRIGQEEHVTYVDLECRGTIDSRIIEVLTNKAYTAEEILKNVKSFHNTGSS